MRTLLLANPFKGSLSSLQIINRARAVFGVLRALPVSDGGDGLLDVFLYSDASLKKHSFKVKNAYGSAARAACLLGGKTCVIETARALGLGAGAVGKRKLNVMQTSSYGLGELIKKASARGAEKFYIGLGGVACNDGGAGMAEALGVKFFDKNKKQILPRTGNLSEIKSIDFSALKKYKNLKVVSLTDVKNPLLGPGGSARIFGPQKGANKKEVEQIEEGLKNLSQFFPPKLKKEPGAAAAGAIAYGLSVFLNAQITDGAEFVFKKLNIEKEIKKADRIIITEGKLDTQTFMGKAPGRAVKIAQKQKKEVHFVCAIAEVKPPCVTVHTFLNANPTKPQIRAALQRAPMLLSEKLKGII